MAAVTRIYTLACAARMLGVAEELLEKIAENLEPGKEGILRIQETLEQSAFGFTDFGIDNVREILDDPPTLESFLNGRS